MTDAQQKNRGIIFIVTSVLCFAVVNTCAKALPHIPVHELIFFRSIVSFSICFWIIKRSKIPVFGNNKPWLLARGFTGLIALLLFFTTLKKMPLASASTIQYLSPVFTVITAIWLNNQRPKRIQWWFFVLAFAGTFLIKGFDTDISWLWLLAGITSAAFAGLAYNAIIRCKHTDHPLVIVMYFPMVSLPILGAWCMFHWVQPVGWDWALLLVMGIFTQLAQYTMTLALHSDVASKVTPWNYTGAIFAIVIGYFVFDEKTNGLALCGMALVVTAVVMNARVKPV